MNITKKIAQTTLARLQADHGWFRSITEASSTLDMYAFEPAIERYRIVPFKEWSNFCVDNEVEHVLKYWLSEGSLVGKRREP